MSLSNIEVKCFMNHCNRCHASFCQGKMTYFSVPKNTEQLGLPLSDVSNGKIKESKQFSCLLCMENQTPVHIIKRLLNFYSDMYTWSFMELYFIRKVTFYHCSVQSLLPVKITGYMCTYLTG